MQSVDEWCTEFAGWAPSRKEDALRQLVATINRTNDENKRACSPFLKGVTLKTNNEQVYFAIREHMMNIQDARGIKGYISKPIAIRLGIVSESITGSSWASLMKTIENRGLVPGFRKHDESLPNQEGKGRRAAVYVCDECDLKALFDERSNLYDPTVPIDARKMSSIICKHIEGMLPNESVDMLDLAKEVDNPLFPKWTWQDLSQIQMFANTYLIPQLSESGAQFVSQGKILRRMS
jgi:hypothetical protein